MPSTAAYLLLSATLFVVGLVGVAFRRNMITVLMCVELMLNAVNINLVAFAHRLSSLEGQVLPVFVITIAAGEAAVGLAIIIQFFRPQRDGERRRRERAERVGHDGDQRASLAGSAASAPRRGDQRLPRREVAARDEEQDRHERRGSRFDRVLSAVLATTAVVKFIGSSAPYEAVYYQWIPAGMGQRSATSSPNFDVDAGFQLDPLSARDDRRRHLASAS